jgi:D-alanine transaminase
MIPGVDNDSTVYLNGQFVRLADATIPVLDRGFIFGDGVYEVVPAYNGKPFRMDGHLARLRRSLAAISIDAGLDTDHWEALVSELLTRNGGGNLMIYIQVTRGVAKREHAFPTTAPTPTIFCMASPFSRPSAAQREQGLSVISIPDERWLHCEIKSISLLGNVLAKQQAAQAGADEVIQFRDGYLSEGAASNIWVVRQGVLMAPPRNHLILEGIRYGLMQELADAAGIAFQAGPISRAQVESADELLLTAATKEVLPITRCDGKPVGTGRPGPVYAALSKGYDQLLSAL